jgi:L-ascorbate metabolism protein UlaG (beta-lactamase superfamily)
VSDADIEIAPTLTITRLGLSMFLIETPTGTRLMTDPWMGETGGNPTLVRDVVTPELLRSLHGLLVSHGHTDHAEGLPAITRVNPEVEIFVGFEFGNLLMRHGYDHVRFVNRGGSTRYRDVTVTFVPASHDNGFRVLDPTGDRSQVVTEYAGLAAGIIVTLPSGYRIYYAGDTGLSAEMRVIGDYWQPDLAIVPVGGGTTGMDPDQAAYATGDLLRVPRVIPCHWIPEPDRSPDRELMRRYIAGSSAFAGMGSARGEEFAQLVHARYPDTHVDVMQLGDSLSVDVSHPRRSLEVNPS